jgi:hypothetical protein
MKPKCHRRRSLRAALATAIGLSVTGGAVPVAPDGASEKLAAFEPAGCPKVKGEPGTDGDAARHRCVAHLYALKRDVGYHAKGRDGVTPQLVGEQFDPGGVALAASIVRLGNVWHIFTGRRGPDEHWQGASRDGRFLAAARPMRLTAHNVNCMMATGIPVRGGPHFYAFNGAHSGQPHCV